MLLFIRLMLYGLKDIQMYHLCRSITYFTGKKGEVIPLVGRGIALLFHDRGTRRGVSGLQHAPAALYPWERTGTHSTGGWVGPRAGLDGQQISSPPGFDPGSSSP